MNRKEHITSIAEELFSQKGYYSTSIADINERAGIARGTFYLYFENKLNIFEEILNAFLADIERNIKTIVISPDHPPPFEQLRSNLYNIFNLLIEKKFISKILLDYSLGVDKELEIRINNFYIRIREIFYSALSLGMEFGIIRNCNPNIVAVCILGCLKELIREIINNQNLIEKRDQIIEELLLFGLNGIINI